MLLAIPSSDNLGGAKLPPVENHCTRLTFELPSSEDSLQKMMMVEKTVPGLPFSAEEIPHHQA